MAEVGEEMCQAEVAHHAHKLPEYFCSRKVKFVYLYKKALAVDDSVQKKTTKIADEPSESDEEADGPADVNPKKKKPATKPSDLELYERRINYPFRDREISKRLPAKDTPEEQVIACSLFDFFRLVHFHGGKHAYFSWHSQFEMPIATMSPAVRLREGPDFEFGAKWALMQYHPWKTRGEFLDMTDEAAKAKFRAWINTSTCPWYVREEYLGENNRRLRGVGKGKQKRMSHEEYQEKIDRLLDDADFDGAAQLKTTYEKQVKEDPCESEADGVDTEEEVEEEEEEEESSAAEEEADENTARILKLLYKGKVEAVDQNAKQASKAKVFNCYRHTYYKNTRVTNTAQEEQSALPAGVINVNEDSSDCEDYAGEQKELAKEAQELRTAAQELRVLDVL